MDIREKFEKLTEIAEILNRNGGGYYKERTNDYHHCNLYFDKFLNGAWYAFQEQQKKIDAHNKKLSIFIDELKKTHSNDKDNKMDYWRGFADCAEASIKVFYRDVGFTGED